MRIHQVRLSLLALAALVAACDRPATPVEPDLEAREHGSSLRGPAGFAIGAGEAQLPPGFSELRFVFAAVQHPNGDASGAFHQAYESAGGTVVFSGRVTCVSFDPVNRRAWVGGVVTSNRSTNPAVQRDIHQPGRDVWFRVVDYSDDGTPADRTTVLGFEGAAGVITSAEYCQRQLWAPGDANTWEVVRGGIRVED